MIRLFVAIDLPWNIRENLATLCFGLPGAKWVSEDQIHLTLRFIGEVDGVIFRDIQAALEEVKASSFPMRLESMGFFPPRKKPRVLWAGVEKNEELVNLRNRVEAALVRCGLAPEGRKFAPHITLARLKGTPLKRLTNFLSGNALYASQSFSINTFHLYSSTLTQKGAIHRLENTYELIQK